MSVSLNRSNFNVKCQIPLIFSTDILHVSYFVLTNKEVIEPIRSNQL